MASIINHRNSLRALRYAARNYVRALERFRKSEVDYGVVEDADDMLADAASRYDARRRELERVR